MATKKVIPTKKQIKSIEVRPVLLVPEGTEVRVQTKMDKLLHTEKECIELLAVIRAEKSDHKAWLKAESEKG